jgi:hypothetical protein
VVSSAPAVRAMHRAMQGALSEEQLKQLCTWSEKVSG